MTTAAEAAMAYAMEEPEAKAPKFDRSEDGRIYCSQDNIALAVSALGVRIRYDMLARSTTVDGLEGFGPMLTDSALNRLRLEIDSRFRFRIGKEFFIDVIKDFGQRERFHPVRDYLDGLQWDGEPRLDGWLTRYAGAEASDYTRAVATIVLIAAVRRVRWPGCKFDEMLVLESTEQGKGKSTALALLAGRSEWFTDDFPVGGDARLMMEKTSGKWIVEAGELRGMSKFNVRWLKAYLSSQYDGARAAYAREPERCGRQFIVIGTTNEDSGYLNDPTGNRRIWPVRIREFDLQALRGDRDQLWAEAAHREACGESIRLDPALYGAAAVQQEARRKQDPLEAILARAFGDVTGKIELTDAWQLLGVSGRPITPDECDRCDTAMAKLGWQRSRLRVGGERCQVYVKGKDAAEREIELTVIYVLGRQCVAPRVATRQDGTKGQQGTAHGTA